MKLLIHSEHRVEYARAQLRLGTAHDDAGSVSMARDAFELALNTALACRATRLADQAEKGVHDDDETSGDEGLPAAASPASNPSAPNTHTDKIAG